MFFCPFCPFLFSNGEKEKGLEKTRMKMTGATSPPFPRPPSPRKHRRCPGYILSPCQAQTTEDPGSKESSSQGTLVTPSSSNNSGNNLQRNPSLVHVPPNRPDPPHDRPRIAHRSSRLPRSGVERGQGRGMQGTTMTTWCAHVEMSGTGNDTRITPSRRGKARGGWSGRRSQQQMLEHALTRNSGGLQSRSRWS